MSALKILFLDIDGVMNSEKWWLSMPEDERRLRWDSNNHFDTVAVGRVNKILEETDARVVISSTWRQLFEWGELLGILKRNGLRAKIIGGTPSKLSMHHRGGEISMWLDVNRKRDIHSIAIIDDDNDMADLGPRLIQTTWSKGIQDEHVDKVIEMLNTPFDVDAYFAERDAEAAEIRADFKRRYNFDTTE